MVILPHLLTGNASDQYRTASNGSRSGIVDRIINSPGTVQHLLQTYEPNKTLKGYSTIWQHPSEWRWKRNIVRGSTQRRCLPLRKRSIWARKYLALRERSTAGLQHNRTEIQKWDPTFWAFHGTHNSVRQRRMRFVSFETTRHISSQQKSTRPLRPILVRTVFLPTTRSTLRPTRTSPPPRATREPNRVVTVLEPTTDLLTTAYKPRTSTASEYVLVLNHNNDDQTDSYVTDDQDWTATEALHPDIEEE